jgi:iron complex outermembrane recepter protein
VGFTALYIGERQAGRSTRLTVANDAFRLIPVAAYTQLNASVGYVRARYSIRTNVSNLLNQLSYNVHDDNSINPIAPRMVSATVSWNW